MMPFGKKVKVGNFTVLKYTKSLSKREVEYLRKDIPQDIRKHLQRGGIPYIKVEAVSGIWAIEYCCNTSVFRMMDAILGEQEESQMTTLAHVFNMWYMDTCVPGDEQFQEEKAAAFKGFMDRCKAKEVSEEADKAVLDELQAHEEAKKALDEMANEMRKEAGNEGNG